MKIIYNHLNEKKFKILSIISCFTADIFVALHIYTKFANKDQFEKTMEMSLSLVRKTNPQIMSQMPANFQAELWGLMITTVTSVLSIYLIVHAIVYLLYFKNKAFAKNYVKLYAWSGGIMMGIFTVLNITNINGAIFLTPSVLLLITAFGFKHFKNLEE